MVRKRRLVSGLAVVLIVISLFATVAYAATVKHNFSFNIKSMTSGTNYHPYAKGSCKVTATANTIDPWDGNERFKVSLKKALSTVTTANYYIVDGATRSQTVTMPSTADYYPQVWLSRNNYGSPTYVKGSGYTSQTM